MTANSFNRQTAREALATILASALASNVQAVYAYKLKSLAKVGKGPFVTVSSHAIQRLKRKLAGTYDNEIFLSVTLYVLWLDPDSGWTEQDCENRRDLLEKKIADALLDHKSTAQDATVPWDSLDFSAPSEPGAFTEGGAHWWTETLRVRVRKLNS